MTREQFVRTVYSGILVPSVKNELILDHDAGQRKELEDALGRVKELEEDNEEWKRFGVTISRAPIPDSFLKTVPEGKRWVFQKQFEEPNG